jgi:hypothetical protein
MDRPILQKYIEENPVLWTLLMVVVGFCLNAASGAITNLTKPETKVNVEAPPPATVNIQPPKISMQPPIINITIPEKKADTEKK